MSNKVMRAALGVVAVAGLLVAGCSSGSGESTTPETPAKSPAAGEAAPEEAADVTVRCEGCGKTETIAADATPPSC